MPHLFASKPFRSQSGIADLRAFVFSSGRGALIFVSLMLAAFGGDARANTVLDFDGTNDFLLSIGAGGSIFDLGNSDLTLEWMIKTDTGGTLIVNRYNPGGEGDRYLMGINAGTGLFVGYFNMGGRRCRTRCLRVEFDHTR